MPPHKCYYSSCFMRSKTLRDDKYSLLLRIVCKGQCKYVPLGLSSPASLWEEKKQLPQRIHPNRNLLKGSYTKEATHLLADASIVSLSSRPYKGYPHTVLRLLASCSVKSVSPPCLLDNQKCPEKFTNSSKLLCFSVCIHALYFYLFS